jgi:hypothetical protein
VLENRWYKDAGDCSHVKKEEEVLRIPLKTPKSNNTSKLFKPTPSVFDDDLIEMPIIPEPKRTPIERMIEKELDGMDRRVSIPPERPNVAMILKSEDSVPLDYKTDTELLGYRRNRATGRIERIEGLLLNTEHDERGPPMRNPDKHDLMHTMTTTKGQYGTFSYYVNNPTTLIFTVCGGVHYTVIPISIVDLTRKLPFIWRDDCMRTFGIVPTLNRINMTRKDLRILKRGYKLKDEKGLRVPRPWWKI